MNIGMAEDAIIFYAPSAMSAPMGGRNGMALDANPISRLLQQPIIRRAMRLVAFHTTTAVYQIIISNGMLMNKWPRFFRMAILAGPVNPPGQGRVFHTGDWMAIKTANITGFQRMHGATFEFIGNSRVTGKAEIFAILFEQFSIWIAVNAVA